MARARQADAALARKKPLGPLHGLPIVVKDTWATAGLRTTSGSKSLEQHVPQEDAVVVARLKAAGAVIVGKTNLPEWAADWQSYNDVAGIARNPWDPARTPGGSTGGGAAAVAAGSAFSRSAATSRAPSASLRASAGSTVTSPRWGVVPMRGHIPPPPGVQGSARSSPWAGPHRPQRRGSRRWSSASWPGRIATRRWPIAGRCPSRATRGCATTASAT